MAESLFIRADEVIRLLGVSKSEAYRIIKRLNDQMAEKGYTIIAARIYCATKSGDINPCTEFDAIRAFFRSFLLDVLFECLYVLAV